MRDHKSSYLNRLGEFKTAIDTEPSFPYTSYSEKRIIIRESIDPLAKGHREGCFLPPALEFNLHSATIDKEDVEAATSEDREYKTEPHPPRFLNKFLRLRAFEALRHRNYRLLWYGQFFVSMGSVVLIGIADLCTVHSRALVQTVIQSYSPSELHGRTMALFNMSRVIMMTGSILVGALSSLLGARWAVASMGSVGALTMIAIYVALPRARLIR